MKQDELELLLKNAGIKNFIDPQFPPRDSSIYDTINDDFPYQNVVHWRRPVEFMNTNKSKIELFSEGIDPNDIK